MQSSDELWEQNYQELINSIPDLIFDDIPNSSSPSPTAENMTSPKALCKGPKGCIGKPVRRRPRTCKKIPTTLLKADANNFRALVQQFTGCHSATPLLRAYKGPINLNFKQCNYYPLKQQQQQQQKQTLQVGYRLHEESDHGGSFFPFGAKSNNVAGVDDEDRELFDSSVGQNPRADALTNDRCDVDSLWEDDDLSGSGDYYSTVYSHSGAMNHEFWGY